MHRNAETIIQSSPYIILSLVDEARCLIMFFERTLAGMEQLEAICGGDSELTMHRVATSL